METKTNPTERSCYQRAMPHEPMFIIFGRDPAAPAAIKRWHKYRSQLPDQDEQQLADALADAERFAEWREEHDGEWRDYDPTEDLVPTPTDELSSLAGRALSGESLEQDEVVKLAGFVLRSDRQAGPNDG